MDRCASIFRPSPWPRNCGLRLPVLRDELQRHAVVAIALAGGLRAVIEQVAVVAAAARAVVLGARIDDLVVRGGLEGARDGDEERGPAGAALVLHFGSE